MIRFLGRCVGWPVAGLGFVLFTVGGGIFMLGLWLAGEEG